MKEMPTTPNMIEEGSEFSVESFSSPERYIQDSIIGNGAYGTVYMATNIQSQKVVAMKKVRIPVTNGIPMSTLREMAMLRYIDRFEHPNIIRLLDVCHGRQRHSGKEKQLSLYLIFEHVDQDLSTFLSKVPPPGLPEVTIKSLVHQILCGIDFLHSMRILHRDLKPQNLLITNDRIIKLADFGLAKTYTYEMTLTTVVVTLWYRSPEVLLGNDYASPLDIWSIGCIMGEMYKGDAIFQGASEGDQLDKIFRVIGSPLESEWPSQVLNWSSFSGYRQVNFQSILPELSDEGNDLLIKLLKFHPSERISAYDALLHPFFKDSTYKNPDMSCKVNQTA